MLKVYHSKRARSARVLWLLEELGVPYQVEEVEFTPEALKSPEHMARHPLGLIPVLDDGPIRIFESGAILEYLLENHGAGRLAPSPGTRERALYLQWFHFGEASVARYLSDVVRQRFRELDTPEISLSRSRARLLKSVDVVERALEGQDYICGASFNAADIMVSYGLAIARIIRELPPEYSRCLAYLDRLRERPAYQRAWA